MTSREHRRSKTSRGNAQIQLPRISKPALQQATFLQRYQWITHNTGYLLLSTPVIEQEQQYIINQLNALNKQYAELLNNLNSNSNARPLKKSRQVNSCSRSNEIRDREIENNNVFIYKLRAQAELLYRRISSVNNGKSNHEYTIIDIKQKILKTKQKIKELKLRSKEMGDSIQSGESGFVELKRLEDQFEANEIKRSKLEEKLAISMANMKNLQQKLDEINSQAIFAEKWLNDSLNNQKAIEQERSMQQLFRQKNYQLQITKKMLESLRSSKQQKYLQLLRGFQEICEKASNIDKKLQQVQSKNLLQRKQMLQLQDLHSQAVNLLSLGQKGRENNQFIPEKQAQQS